MYDKDPLTRARGGHRRAMAGVRPAGFPGHRRHARPWRAGGARGGRPRRGSPIDEVARPPACRPTPRVCCSRPAWALHIVWRRDGRYYLGKLGRVLLDDEMTRVNFDFTRDVCYQAAAHLGRVVARRPGRRAQGTRALGDAVRGPVGDARAGAPELARLRSFLFRPGVSRACASAWRPLRPRATARRGCNTGKWAQAVPRRACRAGGSAWSTCRRNSTRRGKRLAQAGLDARALHRHRPAGSARRVAPGSTT